MEQPSPKTFEPTPQDFESGKVFEYICSIQNAYEQAMAERRMSAIAQEFKFRNFKRLLELYKQNQREKNLPQVVMDGVSNFDEQSLELNTGEWYADELGVYKMGDARSRVVACSHPIMPIQRICSVDTKEVKYKLAYRRGVNQRKPWEYVEIEAADMASPTEIVKKLAPRGISVSGGDRAKALVDYLRDMTDLNYDVIPEVRSVSRLGWNEEGFSPYVDGIEFDGAQAFSAAYKAIRPTGSFDKWLEEAKDARTYSTAARIVLAASFAAPLIEPLGILSFFVHLWSVQSSTGKTVGQMLGASVWGNPTAGGAFFPTFRSTSVGLELMAGFLHSMPVFIDELQLAKDQSGNVRFNVYELASGSGKLRGNKQLGLNYTPKWSTTFITSGETPIVKETDGEGALNRVFEIECYANQKVIEDGHRTSNVLKENYGHAGKMFVAKLQQEGQIDRAKELYEQFYSTCVSSDTTEKQAMAASAVLTADALATEWIFQDGRALTYQDIAEFLKTKERVSLLERGYDLLCDWVSINANRFKTAQNEPKNEIYGAIDSDKNDPDRSVAYIIRAVFTRVCEENALNEKGMLSHLRAEGKILTNGKGYTVSHRFGGSSPHCVALILPQSVDPSDQSSSILGEDGRLPF